MWLQESVWVINNQLFHSVYTKNFNYSLHSPGFLLRPLNPTDELQLLIGYPGEMFMRLLKLFILPLIVSSLIVGSSNLNNELSSKITIRTLLYFATTSMLTATIGILLALIFQPGSSSNQLARSVANSSKSTTILDSFMDLGRWVDFTFQICFTCNILSFSET